MTRQALRARSAPSPVRWEAAVCSWPDDAALDWTRRLVEAARKDAAVEAVVATGSAVREVGHSDDLDLVLVYRAVRPDLPRAPISVDLRCYEPAGVASRLAGGHSYLSWAVRFGRPLFERDLWWSELRAAWNDRLLLPSAAEATERARRAERQRDGLAEAGDDDAVAEMQLSALTHHARAALSGAEVFPRSRPELAGQLRLVGEHALADRLDEALARRQQSAQPPGA